MATLEQSDMNEQCVPLSVSEVAKLEGKSVQTIYNRIRGGIYDTINFKRGKMRGIIINYPKSKMK